ncbi:MAG: glycosyltransferase family 4 protein [Victivallales bacterium]|nr:glycosyltransferase family 4 protein [Victivallales bacterium]
MRILLIYHFFHPDTVISARLFSDLAEDLAAGGHDVTVYTSNRCIRSEGELPASEVWHGVKIRRFQRPGFRQGSNVGRVLNSFILQRRWLKAFRQQRDEFDVVIVGTDPQFCWMMFPKMKRIAPNVRLVHWVFDLYPEALAATGSRIMRLAAWLLRPWARRAYGRVDVMADIGDCMRDRLRAYGHHADEATITPWALKEAPELAPVDCVMRKKLFGDAKLCFLYSGTVGHAHDITPFIELARECRRRELPVAFCFAGYGNRYQDQTAQITVEDSNITLAGFADEEELSRRLAAADFHLISLREGWEGIVVPSKFFASLAMGRPVLFSGGETSEINGWIRQFNLGYRLDGDFINELERLLADKEAVSRLQVNAFATYQEYFSRRKMVSKIVELEYERHTN